MARKSLRAQLNQIRAWVRQGRTDAWIAHQLEVSTSELSDFRRRHDLSQEDEAPDDADLRDEIEAEIEATMAEESDEEDEESDPGGDGERAEPGDGEPGPEDGEGQGDRPRRRRRRRRRGGAGRAGAGMQATFDHGEEGFGLWLDPAVEDDPVYSEHWAGHRPIEVTIEPDRIVIRRT